jgi:hypothetical protein
MAVLKPLLVVGLTMRRMKTWVSVDDTESRRTLVCVTSWVLVL